MGTGLSFTGSLWAVEVQDLFLFQVALLETCWGRGGGDPEPAVIQDATLEADESSVYRK